MLRHRREPTGQLRLSESATFLRSAAFEELPSSWKLKHRKDRQAQQSTAESETRLCSRLLDPLHHGRANR